MLIARAIARTSTAQQRQGATNVADALAPCSARWRWLRFRGYRRIAGRFAETGLHAGSLDTLHGPGPLDIWLEMRELGISELVSSLRGPAVGECNCV